MRIFTGIKVLPMKILSLFCFLDCVLIRWQIVALCWLFQGQAVAQLCSTVPNVAVFGIASCFKHTAIRDSVTHLFDRNVDYMQEVKK